MEPEKALILGNVSSELSPLPKQTDLRCEMSHTITLESLTLNLQITLGIIQALLFPQQLQDLILAKYKDFSFRSSG